MIEEFVPYQPSLELKELGFDEKCFAYFYHHQEYKVDVGSIFDHDKERVKKGLEILGDSVSRITSIPTFSQAFRWFREKYDLFGTIHKGYYWNISGGVHDIGYNTQYDWDSENYSTYEDAQLE